LGPPEAVYIYWALAFVACMFVVFGYRTRVALVVLYLFIAGFNERLPELFDGSDSVIRLTLFWLCFCPCGNRYSLDAIRARLRGTPLPETSNALPMRVVQAQVAWVYFCSALHKTGGNTWHLFDQTGHHFDINNAALHYVLHLSHVFARPWAAMVADYPIPMAIGSMSAMVIEFGFLPLVFFPVWNRKTKAAALVMGTLLHGGIAFTVNVGLFSYLMPVTYLAFFEPAWTDWLIDRLKRFTRAGKTLVTYDGACAACVRGAEALRAFDRFGNLELCDFRRDDAVKSKGLKKGELELRIHAVKPDGTVLSGYAAVCEALSRSPAMFVPAWFMKLPLLSSLGAMLYERQSARRHMLAKRDGLSVEIKPLAAPPTLLPEQWLRTGRDLILLGMVFLAVSAGWYAAPQPGRRYLPVFAERAVQWFSLWNIWDMFSPEPLRTDYHLRAPAEYSDGSTEDLFGGPENGPGEVRGFWFSRWWKYMENVTQGNHVIPEEWARWQCKVHNWGDAPRAHGGRTLYKFKLLRDNQIIPPMGQPWPPVQTGEVVTWRCYDKPADKKPAAPSQSLPMIASPVP